MKLDCGCENDRLWAKCACGASFCAQEPDEKGYMPGKDGTAWTTKHGTVHIHGCPFRKEGEDGIGFVECQIVQPGQQPVGGFV